MIALLHAHGREVQMLCRKMHHVPQNQVEDDYVELARTLMEKAEAKGVKFLLPEDVVIADKVCPVCAREREESIEKRKTDRKIFA